MTKEHFINIFESEYTNWNGDNVFQGLLIISKYINTNLTNIIIRSNNDQMFSVDIDDLINKGLTIDDAKRLRELNWSYSQYHNCLTCFV